MWKYFNLYKIIIAALLACIFIATFSRLVIWNIFGTLIGSSIMEFFFAYNKHQKANQDVKDENNKD